MEAEMTLSNAVRLAKEQSKKVSEEIYVYRDRVSEESTESAFEYAGSNWLDIDHVPDSDIVAVFFNGNRAD
jgi:hypothetical protein